MQVLLWRVAGANENYCVLRGHKQVRSSLRPLVTRARVRVRVCVCVCVCVCA